MQEHLHKVDTLINIISDPEKYSDDTISHYFDKDIFRFNNWLIGDATYKSITSTGKIDLVENYDLKMEIIQLYESRAGQSEFIVQPASR
jgi:hypothetical protein